MSDPRFARLKTDPRFRRPKQKNLKVEIDDRFKDVLESEEFGGKGKGKGKASGRVDKRGRPLASSHHQDQLKRFYRLRSPEAQDGEGEEEGGGFVDYARGEGALSSSGSEDEDSDAEGSENDFDEEELEVGGKRKSKLPGYISESDSEETSDEEEEDDEDHLNIDLSENEDEAVSAFPPEVDEDEEEEEEESVPPTKRIAAVNLDWDNLQAKDLFSVFNSFLKTSAAAGSSKDGDLGKLLSVKIYPSEFGKQRMEKEEQEGPGGGIFVSKHKAGEKKDKKKRGPKEAIVPKKRAEESSEEEEDSDEDEDEGSEKEGEEVEFDDEEEDEEEEEDDEEEDNQPKRSNDRPREEIDGLEIISDVESDAGSEDIDMDQLRQYQLERLRYFYAIATFSTVTASEHVMNECNGTEFERTANIMDLSYVPEDMEFADEEVRDESNKEAKGYKGNDFVTDALRHSKVKLTWDQDDPNRVKMTRRTLTREEIEEQDFNNLVAGSGSEASLSEDEEQEDEKAKGKGKGKGKDKQSKKERTEKLRNLLLAGNDEDGDIWGKAGTSFADMIEPKDTTGKSKKKKEDGMDMEITFKPALNTGVGKEVDEENMTTLEKYQMRMKEKKNRKKEKLELRRATKAINNDEDNDDEDEGKTKGGDDFFGSDSDVSNDGDEDVERPQPKSKVNGKERPSSRLKDQDDDNEDFSTLVGSSSKADTNFSMKDILKSEKDSKKRRRRRGKKDGKEEEEEKELGPEGWKINVADPRFKALHEDAEFAIDPSNPHFTKTKAMQDLLSHRAQLRQNKRYNENDELPSSASGVKRTLPGENPEGGEKDLSALVKSVKRQMEREGNNKKRRRHRK
ncbi:hypothetical protein I302_105775 [Kwoniella bestiolae CBS 10118]|uniref:Uncharacterized protein n=1 Tax=Kwoniella bestiolae CBS 10118 TaxID=1296100 RepID=A0A1B9G236_9TREE|nr:hypothetical protein I302_04897 [Kwoniella bestiolae CBS 10118]OCF25087.1 hypothetical protein I302_04897 [Kwoniella bestiolae CBS 10118]